MKSLILGMFRIEPELGERLSVQAATADHAGQVARHSHPAAAVVAQIDDQFVYAPTREFGKNGAQRTRAAAVRS